jgi:hypothetical protein
MKSAFFGIVPAATLAIGLASASTACAQEFGFPGEVVDGPVLGAGVDGGFGNTYIQPPPVTGIPGNRWSMLGGPSYFEGIPYEAEIARDSPFLTAQPVAAAPVQNRRNGRKVAVAPAPYGTPLPQGRLNGAGMPTPPLYAPYTRYQTYGAAYGMGPYGSNYYSGFWHGQPIYP